MEREYTIGGILVLVVIIVMVLMIYAFVPGFSDEINKIADEVFGITKQEQEEAEKIYKENMAKAIFQNLYDCITTVNEGKGKTCSCSLESRALPEGYEIQLRVIDIETGERELILKQEYDLESKPLKDINLCMVGEDKEPKLNIPKVIDFGEFPPNTPEIYGFDKDNKRYVCFTTKKATNFKKTKDCKTGEVMAHTKSLDFFKSFVSKYELCRDMEKKEICKCSLVDFEELKEQLGYEIRAISIKGDTTFRLYDENGRPVEGGKKTVNNALFGIGRGLETIDYYLGKESEGLKGKNYIVKSNKPYVLLYPLSYAIAFSHPGLAKITSFCTPEYDVYDKTCTKRTDAAKILKRIEETEYQGKTYKRYIEEATKDRNMRFLTAAVMAAESAAEKKCELDGCESKTGCVGLMQFCGASAYDEGLCDKDKKGYCINKDYRKIPSESIKAGVNHLTKKTSFFTKYTYKEVFGLAAYNGGEGTILRAIEEAEKKGIKNPTWQDVKEELTIDVLKSSSPKLYGTWSKSQLKEKITEIKCYPFHVNYFKQEFEATGLFEVV